ncbi:MAG TPA: hypothetical protein VF736_05185, partial [Pyrinomonadaceae bacterium]
MRFRSLALASAAALVLATGAALRSQGGQSAPRKATPRPAPAVEQRQPQKVTQRPEDVKKGADEVPASVRAGMPAKPKEDPNAARYTYEF